MVKRKSIRTRGKISFSRYFKKFEIGDKVSITMEQSSEKKFLKRFQGKSGVIAGKQGEVYIVKLRDQKKEKRFLIEPIHLKKIK